MYIVICHKSVTQSETGKIVVSGFDDDFASGDKLVVLFLVAEIHAGLHPTALVSTTPVNMLCAIGGTYLFGFVLKMGVLGAYIGLVMDEIVRGVIMFIRWKSGKWERKVIVKKSEMASEDITE